MSDMLITVKSSDSKYWTFRKEEGTDHQGRNPEEGYAFIFTFTKWVGGVQPDFKMLDEL